LTSITWCHFLPVKDTFTDLMAIAMAKYREIESKCDGENPRVCLLRWTGT